jgi:hypothetical protein
MVKPSPALIEGLRAQRSRMVRWDRFEFDLTVAHVGGELPEWRTHPYLTRFLAHWHSRHAGSLPDDWFEAITEKCRKTFSAIPWPQRADAGSVSLAECRRAGGATTATLSDADLGFLRDQLYVLAEIVVARTRSEDQ